MTRNSFTHFRASFNLGGATRLLLLNQCKLLRELLWIYGHILSWNSLHQAGCLLILEPWRRKTTICHAASNLKWWSLSPYYVCKSFLQLFFGVRVARFLINFDLANERDWLILLKTTQRQQSIAYRLPHFLAYTFAAFRDSCTYL